MHPLVQAVRTVLFGTGMPRTIVRGVASYIRENGAELRSSKLVETPPAPGRYLCHRDPEYGFAVMLVAWAPGDSTPIHDHGTWGVEFVLRSALEVTRFGTRDPFNPEKLTRRRVVAGDIDTNVPPEDDVHQVVSPEADVALSLHVYGRVMDQCRVFTPGEGLATRALASIPWEGGLDHLRCAPAVRRVIPDVRRGAFAEG
jgi:predicted metal-dependent enzyme (double-stranded beta helix superfamily)